MPSDSISHLRVGTAIIEPVNEVRDIGITLDFTLTLRTHINNICCSSSLSLHELSEIRKFLSQRDTEKRVVHAFISSKLGHCNGLFYGLPSSEIQKLQRLQNAGARLITRTKKIDHITPVLINLHWLPIEHRVIFKLLLFTYKALHGQAPDYFANLLTFYKPVRTLRSCYVSINLQNYMLLLTNRKLNLKKIYCCRIQLQDQGVSSSERNTSEHLDNRYLQ